MITKIAEYYLLEGMEKDAFSLGGIGTSLRNGFGAVRTGIGNGITAMRNGINNGVTAVQNGINNGVTAVRNGAINVRNSVADNVGAFRGALHGNPYAVYRNRGAVVNFLGRPVRLAGIVHNPYYNTVQRVRGASANLFNRAKAGANVVAAKAKAGADSLVNNVKGRVHDYGVRREGANAMREKMTSQLNNANTRLADLSERFAQQNAELTALKNKGIDWLPLAGVGVGGAAVGGLAGTALSR